MSVGLYSHTTRATGTILTAAIYNSDHQNHITNQNPLMTGAYSDNLTEHQTNTDPGGLGTEVLGANLADELAQLRFCIKRITGKAQWYIAPATNLDSVGGTITDLLVAETVTFQGDITPAQITANQNNYAPTGHADAFLFRLSSDASRDITGLAGGADGRIVVLSNIGGSFDIILRHEDAASTAANRFNIRSNINLRPGLSLMLTYDSTLSRWRNLGGTIYTNPIFDGNVTMLGNLGTVVNLTQTGYTDLATLADPASPSAGSLRHYTKDVGSGVLRPAYKNSAGVVTVQPAPPVRAYGEFTSLSAMSASIPLDDTIPQNTEGAEIVTATLPALSNASNRVRIRFSAFWVAETTASAVQADFKLITALFKDSDVDALQVVVSGINVGPSDAGSMSSIASFVFEFAPGAATSAVYKVRMGPATGFTSSRAYRLNGNSSGRLFGGAARASLVVEEVIV